MTTGTEWGVAERLKSGVAPSAINPSVDVQSVPVVPLIQTTKMQETITKKTLFPTWLDYVGSPCKGLGLSAVMLEVAYVVYDCNSILIDFARPARSP